MGSSFTRFHDKGFWSRDHLLEVWLRLAALNLPREAYAGGWLRHVRDEWLLQSSGMFGGYITPNLDQLADTPEKVEQLLAVSDRTIEAVRRCGETVPAAALNLIADSGTFTQDYPVDYLEEIHDAFCRLLRRELTWDVSSSPTLPTRKEEN